MSRFLYLSRKAGRARPSAAVSGTSLGFRERRGPGDPPRGKRPVPGDTRRLLRSLRLLAMTRTFHRFAYSSRLIAFRYALEEASMMSVEAARPCSTEPFAESFTVTSPSASLPEVTDWIT